MRRWAVVAIFFAFLLLHQSDRLLIGPLTTPIMDEFGLDEAQMGAALTGALLVAVLLFPVWGYLFDRFARARLLALAALIWGSTTWLSALAPNYPAFLITRASTGIDDSTYPGIYSLLADYFGPEMRSKVYAILQLTAPLGFLIGTALALTLRDTLGWRGIFLLTGALGLVVAALIAFGVKEPPRGRTEPELRGLEAVGVYRFDWRLVRQLPRKRSLWFLWAQGFCGVFPWNVIGFWFFRYLETERGYAETEILVTMAAAVGAMALGFLVAGVLGDWAFQRNPRGRLIVCAGGVLAGAALLPITLNVPAAHQPAFLVALCLTALFIPFASPNVVSTVHDITLPEIRGTALSVQSFIEESGAALAPLLTGLIAVQTSLRDAILLICLSAWLLCAAFFICAALRIPTDIATLREQLRERAEALRS
jgi:MFS family permease